jgi:hypothetical protein
MVKSVSGAPVEAIRGREVELERTGRLRRRRRVTAPATAAGCGRIRRDAFRLERGDRLRRLDELQREIGRVELDDAGGGGGAGFWGCAARVVVNPATSDASARNRVARRMARRGTPGPGRLVSLIVVSWSKAIIPPSSC